nr:hypothetical protein [Phytoactinopolyspora halophila]
MATDETGAAQDLGEVDVKGTGDVVQLDGVEAPLAGFRPIYPFLVRAETVGYLSLGQAAFVAYVADGGKQSVIFRTVSCSHVTS